MSMLLEVYLWKGPSGSSMVRLTTGSSGCHFTAWSRMDVMVRGLSDMRPRTFGGEEVVVEIEVEEKCRRRDVSLKDVSPAPPRPRPMRMERRRGNMV